jgi:intein/homing endonuclease
MIIIENKKAKVVEIGEWIDNYLDNTSYKDSITYYGEADANMELLDISKLGVQAYTLSTDDKGNVQWHHITNVTRHDPSEYIYHIKTKWGREVSVVASKSLLVWDDDAKAFQERNSDDVRIGDKVPVTIRSPQMVTTNYIDMMDYLPCTEYLYGSLHNAGKTHYPVKKFPIEDGRVYLRCCKRNGHSLPDMFELNRENGFFIGLYLAEGNTCKDYVGIANNDEHIQRLVRVWFDKFGISHTTQVKPFNPNRPGLSTSVRGHSTILVQFLEKILGKYSNGKYIPHVAYTAPDEFVKGLIDGYISGDGCITDYHVVVSSVSKQLILGVSQLLSRYGIFAKISMTQQKSNNVGSANILPRFNLHVQSNYVYKFAQEFTLSHQGKQEKLMKLVARNTLGSMSYMYEEQNDVILDKIVSIEKVEAKSNPNYEKVYDITVPNTLNFQIFNGLNVRDTSETGYIQRRLVKAMEDCKIYYDQTVRNATGVIVQFLYGEDGMDGTKVEKQMIPTIDMNQLTLDAMYHLRPEDNLAFFLTEDAVAQMKKEESWVEDARTHFQQLMEDRAFLIEYVFHNQKNNKIQYPIPFERILKTAKQRLAALGVDGIKSDLTPGYILKTIADLQERLYILRPEQGMRFLHILLRLYLSPKPLLTQFNMSKAVFDWVVSEIERYFVESVAQAGEMVGIIAAQTLGEINTQLSCRKDTRIRVQGHTSFNGEMGTFIDDLLEKHAKDVVDLGSQSVVLDLKQDYYIVGVSNQEKTSWKRISQISRHPANGGLVTVKTRSGRKTTATLSHSFLKRTPIGIVPVLGSDLKVGNRIPVARKIPCVEAPLQSIAIGKQSFALDAEFGWFLGAYLADGSLGHGSVSISKTEPVFEDRIRAFGTRYGNTVSVKLEERASPWNDKTYATKSIHLFNQPLQRWVEDNFGRGSYKKHVAAWVYGCSEDFMAGIVSGYFDGDGNVNAPRQMIRAHSVNEGLIDDMIVLLAHCGIFATKAVEHRAREKANKFFVAHVSRKYAADFANKVGLHVPHKKEALQEICQYNDTKSFSSDHIDMIPEVDDLLDSVSKTLHMPGQSRMYGKFKRMGLNRISREALQKYYALFQHVFDMQKTSLTPSEVDQVERELALLSQATNSDVVWDEIVELEYLADPGEFVYDFTVPGNDSFMVDTAVLVHNTLDSFHSSGTAAAVKATSGVPRLKELLSVSKNIKTPTLQIFLKSDVGSVAEPKEDEEGNIADDRMQDAKEKCMKVLQQLETTRLADILDNTEIYWDPADDHGFASGIQGDKGFLDVYRAFSEAHRCRSSSPWVLRMKINKEKLYRLGLSMMDVYLRIYAAYNQHIDCVFSDDNAPELVFRVRLTKEALKDVDLEDSVAALKAMEHNLVHNVLLKGMKGIKKVSMRMVNHEDYSIEEDRFVKVSEWILDTDGSNLVEMLSNPNIDPTRTKCNDVWEIYHTLGIEAARNALYAEFQDVVGDDALNYRHMSLLLDTMSNRGTLMSVDRHGINRGDVGPLAKSSFEETTDMLINASIFSEFDRINGVSANIMLGQLPPCGTGDHEVLLDEEAFLKIVEDSKLPEPQAAVPEPAEYAVPEACSADVIAMPFKIPSKQKKTLTKPTITFV